jgi:hypothetical protein
MRLLLTLLLLTTTLPAQDTPKNLGVLLFPGFELLDATGPLEVWGNLKDRVTIVTLAPEKGPVTSSQGITLIADHALIDTPPLDLLLVPGGFGVRKLLNLETGMERGEDGVVLGSTRLSGSQRLHRKGDATREAGSLVGPMTAADSPSALSVFRFSLETEMERDEDGVVLGSTGLSGSQRLHR